MHLVMIKGASECILSMMALTTIERHACVCVCSLSLPIELLEDISCSPLKATSVLEDATLL